jgi:NADH-quinone oxidoreductase subunit B
MGASWCCEAKRGTAHAEGLMAGPNEDREERRRAPGEVGLLRDGSQPFQTSRVDALLGWARKHSMAVYPFASSCCGLELMSTLGPRYDMERFGCSMLRYSPRHSDLLMVVGTVSRRLAPMLEQIYAQMAEPKWVIAFGACSCSGGPYDNYATLQGIEGLVPVDIYIPGCPPRPEAVLDGLMKLQKRVQSEKVARDGRHRESQELNLSDR